VNSEWLIVLTIVGSIGVALMFVGALMTVLIAFGNRHHIFGAVFFLLFIVPSILARQHRWLGAGVIILIPVLLYYYYRYPQATSYARRLFLPGLAVSVVTGLIGAFIYFRYGLVF